MTPLEAEFVFWSSVPSIFLFTAVQPDKANAENIGTTNEVRVRILLFMRYYLFLKSQKIIFYMPGEVDDGNNSHANT